MKLGLLVVLAVAVLVPSLSEARIVSKCELKEKLGAAITLPRRLQRFKERILTILTCELDRRTDLDTAALKVYGRRVTTTVKPTTRVATRPTRGVNGTTLETTTSKTTTLKTTTLKTTTPETTAVPSNSSGGVRNKREADGLDKRLDEAMNEEEGEFDEEEMMQDDNDMGDDDDEGKHSDEDEDDDDVVGDSDGDSDDDAEGKHSDEDDDDDDRDDDVDESSDDDDDNEEELKDEDGEDDDHDHDHEQGDRWKRSLGNWRPKRKWRPWSLAFYGIFQLSDSHFCYSGYRWSRNICRTSCTAFTNDDITDDIECFVKTRYWWWLLRKASRRCRRAYDFLRECK